MRIKEIKIDVNKETLKAFLGGKVFHVTSRDNIENILKDSCIENNKDGKYKCSFPQSENSFGKRKGYVSLFDFREGEYISKEKCFKEELDYEEWVLMKFMKFYNKDNAYFILKESCYKDIIPWSIYDKEHIGAYETNIPYFECWYKDKIDLSIIEEIIIVEKSK